MSNASEEFQSELVKEFDNALTKLVTRTLPKATSMFSGKPPDQELAAAMPTLLAQQCAFVAATICHGNEQAMSTFLDGLTQFIYEQATGYNQTLGKLKQFQWKGPGRFPGDAGGEAA
jgi:hypothetical protein